VATKPILIIGAPHYERSARGASKRPANSGSSRPGLVQLEVLHSPSGLVDWTQRLMTKKLHSCAAKKPVFASLYPITWPSRFADTLFR